MELEGTKESPRVVIDTNQIVFEGVCMPENAFEFFEPIHAALPDALASSSDLQIRIFFTYLNSTSNKHVLKVLKAVEKEHPNTKVHWHHKSNDRLMEMKGAEMNKFCKNLTFEIIKED